MRTEIIVDVVVIGAGVAGLMLSKKLSDLGLKIALIESSRYAADGPSVQNEGWLHRGTYHAVSIRDRSQAVRVARRCMYGHEQIKCYAPESVEDAHLPTYALVEDEGNVGEVESRWIEAGVQFKEVQKSYFEHLEPNVELQQVAKIFRVHDLSINTRILYRKLLVDCARTGVRVFTNARHEYLGERKVDVNAADHEPCVLKAEIFIYTAGYRMKDLLRSQHAIEVPFRYWKSHLLLLPRINQHGVFYVDPHHPAMMHHDAVTIVGMNEDAVQVEVVDESVISEKVAAMCGALRRMFRHIRLDAYQALSCIKVDVDSTSTPARSLDVNYGEPIPNHFWLLPGKMTEAPFATDYMTRLVCDRIDDGRIALRPCDTHR